MKKYRIFGSEFKRDLITRIDAGELSLTAASRENNLSPSLIQRWRQQIHCGGFKDRPTPKERKLEKEVEWYKQKVGELTRQVDLLKKINESFPPLRKSNGCVVTAKTVGASGRPAA
jgi:transposase-like protein